MTPAPSDVHVRALAAEILRRGEYGRWRTLDWFRSILDWLVRLPQDSPPLYWALLGGLVLVTVLLLAHITVAIRAALAAPPPAVPSSGDAERPRFFDEAEVLAAAGQFLEAARRLQLAVIELLLRRRVVALARSDPNRILRARLRDAALPDGDRRDLLVLIDRLERSWFRDRTADRALYESWRDVHERLTTLRAA
jgi:hypothetical protein